MAQTNAQPLFRFVIPSVEKISPKTVGKWGIRLWFTPPRYKLSLPEKLLSGQARRQRIPFAKSRHQNGSETFYTVYTWGEGPAVLLVHGWGGCAAQMAPLAKELAGAGQRVVAFDALAHGDSPGRRTDILEMSEIIKDLHDRLGGFRAVVAHGMGATAAVAAIREGVSVEKLVTIGAAASVDFYLAQLARQLRASRKTMGRISTYINTKLKRNIKEFSIINIAPTLGLPALIVHDKHDEVVAYTEAVALAKCWPRSELLVTTGLGHSGPLRDTRVLSQINRYLVQEQRISV
ncbi:MAG: alpha/beta fold hydrolase [Calditrichaeota bacterium]|nr:MAG: alpha/beta fold hydrolase [Calditrichota bacterium]